MKKILFVMMVMLLLLASCVPLEKQYSLKGEWVGNMGDEKVTINFTSDTSGTLNFISTNNVYQLKGYINNSTGTLNFTYSWESYLAGTQIRTINGEFISNNEFYFDLYNNYDKKISYGTFKRK